MTDEIRNAVEEAVERELLRQMAAPFGDVEVVDACRQCGCSQYRACTQIDGTPCRWIAPQLCSSCAAVPIFVYDGMGQLDLVEAWSAAL